LNFLGIGYQVLGQFLHLKARGTFGYIIRVALFVHATYSHSQWLFYKFISEITKELVKQSLRVTVDGLPLSHAKKNKQKKIFCLHLDSNPEPNDYESNALSIELSHLF